MKYQGRDSAADPDALGSHVSLLISKQMQLVNFVSTDIIDVVNARL